MPANVESMFYVGEMPWHKEGVPLDNPPSSEKAIIAAGLNWTVSKTRLYTGDGLPVPDHFGIVRSNDRAVLGVVKRDYVPLQNAEAFAFFDPLLKSNFLEYETAGALGCGETIWILAKLKQNPMFSVHGMDEVIKYLLLSNSHDGSSAVNVKFTPIRVVCQNTLNLALKQGEDTRIRHIASMRLRLADTGAAAADILRVYGGAEENFRAMFRHRLNEKNTRRYFNALYPVMEPKEALTESQEKTRERNFQAQNQLMQILESGVNGALGIRGTLWAAYNAVTHIIDHPANYPFSDNRLLKRIWFGEGESIKAKAYSEALLLMRRNAA